MGVTAHIKRDIHDPFLRFNLTGHIKNFPEVGLF
jgi:hypothetical protein